MPTLILTRPCNSGEDEIKMDQLRVLSCGVIHCHLYLKYSRTFQSFIYLFVFNFYRGFEFDIKREISDVAVQLEFI